MSLLTFDYEITKQIVKTYQESRKHKVNLSNIVALCVDIGNDKDLKSRIVNNPAEYGMFLGKLEVLLEDASTDSQAHKIYETVREQIKNTICKFTVNIQVRSRFYRKLQTLKDEELVLALITK